MKINATKYDVDKLIEEAIGPDVWKEHVTKNLMKFWDKPEITGMKDGLFPTYITNSGEPLTDNIDEWPTEFKEAVRRRKRTD